jgi:hypothetical protein
MNTNLLPSCFFLGECIQRFIQRIGDDSPHSLIPTPIRINAGFPQQMHKRLFALFKSCKAVVRNQWIIREVWSRGKDAARRKWESRTRERNRAICAICEGCRGWGSGVTSGWGGGILGGRRGRCGTRKNIILGPRDNRKMALHATGQHELASLGFLLHILEEKKEFIWHVPLGFF